MPLLLLLVLGAAPAHGEELLSSQEFSQYYEEQKRESGAEELPARLPDETRESLNRLGVDGADWESLSALTPEGLFSMAAGWAEEASGGPLRAGASVLAVILLCALVNGMKLTLAEGNLGQAAGLAGTLCVTVAVVRPVVACVEYAGTVIQAAADFLLACVPVLAGILLAAGEPTKAASYQMLMTAAGNGIALLSAYFLVPLINCFLALSLVSAVSPGVRLGGLCDMFARAAKWVLGFCMAVFSGLLAVHSLVATAADSAASRAVKFAVSSFVPVVGGALGEALHTVSGCVSLLKSGVAAFALLAEGALFLPAVLQCLFWQLVLAGCGAVSEVFGLKELGALLSAAGKAVGLLLATLLCTLAVVIISSVAMILLGGGNG